MLPESSLRILVAMILLLSALPGAALAEENCSHKLLTTAEAELGPEDLLLIHAQINDQPVLLAVDTGAELSTMFAGGVARLGLPVDALRGDVSGLDGRSLNTQTKVARLEIGPNFRSRQEDFPISPISGVYGDIEVVGLLGGDYLSNYDLEIDLADHRVNIFYQDHCPGKVVYWADSYNVSDIHVGSYGAASIDVELDGERFEALIDTGSAQSALRMGAARTRLGISPDSAGVQQVESSRGIGGESLPRYRYAFKTLKFGDLTLHNPSIDLLTTRNTPSVVGAHLRVQELPDMLVGMSLLKHLRLYIAYREHKIYYTVVAAPAQK